MRSSVSEEEPSVSYQQPDQEHISNYLFQLRAPKRSSSAFSDRDWTNRASAPGAVDTAASANQAWQELLKL